MKVGAIIQARMGSKRLPGKVLSPILGKPVLWHIVERLKRSKFINEIIIATSDNEKNKPIVEMAKQYGFNCYAGSEEDLIDRFYQAAKLYNLDVVVRIAADRPLIDPQITDETIEVFINNLNAYDCVNNCNPCHVYPHGMETEVFSLSFMEKLWQEIKDPIKREWFTTVIYKNPQKYKIFCLKNSSEDLSHLVLTLDYPEDLELIRYIYENLYTKNHNFLLKDILWLYNQNPEKFNINKKYDRDSWFLLELEKGRAK